MDAELGVTHPSFELRVAEMPKPLMQPLAIIEPFDEHKDLAACLVQCGDVW